MRVFVGTSGYSYKEWKGSFYPPDTPASRFLETYARALETVEINNTFYRMPTPKLVEGWAGEVPQGFTFAIKAPQRITHVAKLTQAGDAVTTFVETVGALGSRLGPLLFQLPPFLRKDVPRLRDFMALAALRDGAPPPRIAFEFRHRSWFDDEVFDTLRAHGAALCVAETEDLQTPVVATAGWGYVRLRREAYSDALLEQWAARIRAQPWTEAFVYVKHDQGDAPAVARRLVDEIRGGAKA